MAATLRFNHLNFLGVPTALCDMDAIIITTEENIMSKTVPLFRRAAEPDDLIGAALLLTTPSGNYITGQNIVVDGGFLAGGSWTQDAI